MIAAEKEKSTSLCSASVYTGLVEKKLMEELQVVYNADKKWVTSPLFNLVGEVIVDIIKQ